MCHRKHILASPCQGEAKKGSLWQATLNRVHSTPSACQSELAEASTTFCGPSASRQYTPRAMPSSATMEGTISSEMERSVRRVSFAASDNLRWRHTKKAGRGIPRSAFLKCAIMYYSMTGPAATRALPASLVSYFLKFLMKRPARSLAFSSQTDASA